MVLTRSQPSEEVEPNISSGASSMAPNKEQPEVTSAQVQSAMLEALQRTSHSLEEALERLSTRSSSPPSAAPPVVLKLEDYLPTFSGDPDEDPDYFIQRLEEYFAEPANTNLSEEVKVRVVYKQLRGPVFKRYKAFASRDREFRAVKDRLMTHYGVEKNFTALYETFQKGHVEKCEDFEASSANLREASGVRVTLRVEHCPGKNNELPDVLSRQPEDAKVPDDAEDLDRMLVPT
jgi:hypothetical protein